MRCGGRPGNGLSRRPSAPEPGILGDGLEATRLHHQRTSIVGLERGGERWAVGGSPGGPLQDWRRLGCGSREKSIGAVVLVEHRRDERPARREVRPRVDALEEGLLVDAGVTAVVGVLPVGGVLIVIDRALVNVVVVTLEDVIVEGLLFLDGPGGHLLTERGLLLRWALDALRQGAAGLRPGG